MAKAELKTQKNDRSVAGFIDKIPDESQKADCRTIYEIMKLASGEAGSMWGSSIVGFGSYTYKYASGQQGDWMKIGFSPRKGKTILYIMDGFDKYDELLSKLGPHSTAKSCLYIKQLDKIDQKVLQTLIAQSFKHGVMAGEVK